MARLLRGTLGAYFCKLAAWPLDMLGCLLLAVVATPPGPYLSDWFLPIFVAWMAVRLLIARLLRGSAVARAASLRTKRERATAMSFRLHEALYEYFRSRPRWVLELILCYLVAGMVTPADPYSLAIAFFALAAVWFPIRRITAYRLRRRHVMPA